MVIARLFDKELEMRSRYRFILPYQRTQAAHCNDVVAPVCLTGLCDIQKHTDLNTIISEIPWGSPFTHQFAVRGVHEFDPLYPLLPTADNKLSILREVDRFLELCSSVVQVRRVDVVNSIARFDEAV